ncbi:MAG: hypothetical protein N4A62_21510 [Marinisporobacter sp.]|jgi:hypothetical protein|nr:hypothetical protein [Marinisporobacter sp.]
MNIGEQLLAGQPMVATMITATLLLLLLMEKDELEQYAFNNALKTATVITIIALFGYSLYMLSVGSKKVSINTIFLAIEGLYIITLVLYYMDLKGIRFEMKMKNQILSNIFMYISIIISILATVSMVFEFEFFENKIGLIRYDELILYVNAILVAMMIPLTPMRKKVNHEEHKKVKKEIDKQFNIMCGIYCISMLLIVIYMIYQKVI